MSLSLIVLSQSHDLDFRATSTVLQRVSSVPYSLVSALKKHLSNSYYESEKASWVSSEQV